MNTAFIKVDCGIDGNAHHDKYMNSFGLYY